MTIQDILQEAQRLSVPEQIHLASQLIQSGEQSMQTLNPKQQIVDKTTPQPNSINYLMEHPIPVTQYHPLTRDELYDRE